MKVKNLSKTNCYHIRMNTKTHTVGTVPKPNQYKLLPSGSLQMVSNDLFVYKFVHSIVLHSVDSCIVV